MKSLKRRRREHCYNYCFRICRENCLALPTSSMALLLSLTGCHKSPSLLQDGWGSYPDELQNCPVFQHAFQVGRRFYLAFQQHTSLQSAHQQANLFGAGQSFSFVRQLGPNVALVAPDVRAERTRKQVVSPQSWEMIFSRMEALPSTVRHVVLLTTIPVVYPKAGPTSQCCISTADPSCLLNSRAYTIDQAKRPEGLAHVKRNDIPPKLGLLRQKAEQFGCRSPCQRRPWA